MNTRSDTRTKSERAIARAQQKLTPGALERVVITLPNGLVERLTEIAEQKGLTRSGYIRMVLQDHLTTNSMEDVDRQLWELAKRADKRAAAMGGDLPNERGPGSI
jgi:predicted DNA-binding protein